MDIIIAFGQGFQAAVNKIRLVLYLWLLSFLFSLLIVAPIGAVLEKNFSRSLLGETIFRRSDLLWAGDLLFRYRDLGPAVVPALLPLAIIFLLIQVFLNGGIIGRLAAPEKSVRWASFCGDAGKYFGRFLRVILLALPVYILFFGLFGRLISAPFNLWADNAATEWGTFWASALRVLVLLLLFSCLKMFFDYLKIRLVAEDSRRVIRTSLTTARFLKARFVRAWFLFLIVGAVFLAVSFLYLSIAKSIPKTGTASFILASLWEQIFVATRWWMTILFFATEYHFLKRGLKSSGSGKEADA